MFPTIRQVESSSRRKSVFGTAIYLPFLVIALLVLPVNTHAQTATVFGALSNFDVVNNTEHEAHGFEIELEGLQAGDVYYTFGAQRYGTPVVVPYATGVRVHWASAYDASAQRFLKTTVTHAPNTPFAGSCYQWGVNYAASGCEHFGVTLRTNASKTTYRWLIEDPVTPGALALFDPPVAIPAPVYVIIPPAQPAEAPILEAEIEAPEPPEAPELFGNAQWVKVFKTEMQREVTLEELMSDNPIVPQDEAHAEVAWEILQADPPSNGKQKRSRNNNQGAIGAGTRSVIRRYEIYQYTGAYDPVTHEVVCGDGLCNAPLEGEVGDFIGAQMSAVNVGVPSVTVAKTAGGDVSSADRSISCGNKCAANYNMNDSVTLTAKPNSGSIFMGWGGACSGAQLTCTVSVNEALNITATFATQITLSVSNRGSGSVNGAGIDCGKVCSAKFTEGSRITLMATPAAGAKFTGWSGACSGSSQTCTFTVSKNASQVQAIFK